MSRKNSSLNESSEKKRSPKGKARIVTVSGRLKIQFPRHVYEGEQEYLALRLADTSENMAKANRLLQVI